MNYKGKKIAITGRGGFIAEALFKELDKATDDGDRGVQKVFWLYGDIRDPKTFEPLTYEFDYLFHFAAPSSQVLFKRQAEYCVDVTVNGFLNAARACRDNGVKLIYPSTGLLSSDRYNEYAMCKKICEDVALSTKMDAIGVRVFASYGAGEGHKRDYASVPYLFIRDLVKSKRPVIYGDGEQVRDFIHISDVVQALMHIAEECNEPIVDIGSGSSVSFNDIVKLTNELLGTDIKPVYVDRPNNYVKETSAQVELMREFYKPNVSLREGIKEIIESCKELS